MTIVITFHQSWYQNLKTYYIHFVCRYLNSEFPKLISYTRMLKCMQCVLVPLCSLLFALTSLTVRQGQQRFPLLSHLSYRFVTTYIFLDIRFLKGSRSE
uniref:hypothetical protein n=1 Tax=Candidatus Enterovibrio escicola TaxID=1927127 RepID=UPI001CC24179|nr:hypothetical protein [Candidatus Enterovibrio escacola]